MKSLAAEQLDSQIKIFYEIISRNNKFGSLQIGDFKFFYKILNINDYHRELKGYNIVKQYYNGANGVLLIFDITSEKVFIKLIFGTKI